MVGHCGFVPTAMCGPPALVQARLITVCFRLPYILPRGWLLRRNAAAILQLQAYFTDRYYNNTWPRRSRNARIYQADIDPCTMEA